MFQTSTAFDGIPQVVNRMTAEDIPENSTKKICGVEKIDNDGGVFEAHDREQVTEETGQRKPHGRHRE